ncbi:hypothetical protein C8Z91_07645 [Paenibacillus elgii]|uniref:Uncharacterized protein n=1 Tax=Paenibacillus elgii TaxID=189691 RepID=A0A2T6G6J1_9BACL|nr:hypothetical protein [Paenibacillus elgii]PUA39778.1 hypothetical protein C8Z91_07645 [Paenibacillus elgii]
MSEFSESYHLKTKNQEDVVELLKKAEKKGYVFEEANGWVTFVCNGNQFQVDEGIVSHNPGVLLHYIYAGDYCWELKIFKKNELVFDYKCEWTDEIHIEKNIYDINVIKELVLDPEVSLDDIEAIFINEDEDAIFGEIPPAHQFSDLIGLVNVEWVSFDYLEGRELENGIFTVNNT